MDEPSDSQTSLRCLSCQRTVQLWVMLHYLVSGPLSSQTNCEFWGMTSLSVNPRHDYPMHQENGEEKIIHYNPRWKLKMYYLGLSTIIYPPCWVIMDYLFFTIFLMATTTPGRYKLPIQKTSKLSVEWKRYEVQTGGDWVKTECIPLDHNNRGRLDILSQSKAGVCVISNGDQMATFLCEGITPWLIEKI